MENVRNRPGPDAECMLSKSSDIFVQRIDANVIALRRADSNLTS